LRVAGLRKDLGGVRVLDGVCLDVREGELLCVLGPSGCGKTTLLRCIAGLDRQDAGTITQGGAEVSDLPARGRDFGLVFQSYALFPNLTTEANIGYGLKSLRIARHEREQRVADLAALMRLEPHLDKYPSQLSGGEQQRVALARALAMQPRLLMLDEPLSAVDARVRMHLRSEILEIQRRLGITTILVTHDQHEAMTIADRVAVMNRGFIEQIGAPQDIYRHPATAFVADFVGTSNLLPAFAAADGRFRVGSSSIAVAGPVQALAAGTPLVLCIAPAEIRIAQPGVGEVNQIATRVSRVEFYGNFFRVVFLVEGCNLSLRADFWSSGWDGPDLSEGSAHRLVLPPDRLRILPPGPGLPSAPAGRVPAQVEG
jgi:iron(III) transport system ATP-binding protein